MDQVNKKIKIAHVTTVETGLKFLLLNQLKSIKSANYEVVGISGVSHPKSVKEIESEGIPHIPIPHLTLDKTPNHNLTSYPISDC